MPSASPGDWGRSPSTPPRCAPSSACSPTAARSTPTPGSRTSRVDEDESGIDITIAFGSEERFDVPIASIKQDLYTRLGARPDAVVRIRIDQPPVRRVLARVADVPGFGWQPLEPRRARPTRCTVEERGRGRRARWCMANGLVTVAVDPDDGTFALDGVAGLRPAGRRRRPRRLVQLLSRPPATASSTPPTRCRSTVTEPGPGAGRGRGDRPRYTWPDHVDGVHPGPHR